MEALASYGSDSEDDEACSSSAPHVIATTTASSAPSSDAASSAAAFATASAAVTAPPVAALRFDARVPPRPAGGCDAATQERVVALREREGNFTDTLRRNKKFGNPYLLRQVVEHFKIDETGSNFVAPAASGSSGSGSARFAPGGQARLHGVARPACVRPVCVTCRHARTHPRCRSLCEACTHSNFTRSLGHFRTRQPLPTL